MPDVFLGLFKQLVLPETIVNGLAFPDYPPIVGGKFDSIYERDRGFIKSTLLAGVGFTSSDSAVRAVFRSPGKYTSEMRQVIQALYSQGLACPYDYKYNICHGVYTAADNSKWVIEISSSGVLAAPMPVITPTLTEHAWLGYTPDYDANLFDAGNPDLITLAASTELTDFYAKTPVFNACGWAFNNVGNVAQNCCTTGGTGSGLATGYRYSIAISETANEPSSAVMSLTESGDFALQRQYGLKIPSSGEDKLEQTSHQDGQSGIGTFSGPRYVYFDGVTPIVTRSEGVETTTTNPGTAPPYNGTYAFCYSSTSYNVCCPGRISEYSTSGTYRGTSAAASLTESTAGTVVDGYTVSPDVSGSSIKMEEYTIEENRQQVGRDGLGKPAFDLKYVNATSYEFDSGFRESVSYCIIPLWDRETVYQYQWDKQYNVENATMWETVTSGGTAGFAYGETGVCQEVSSVTQPGNNLYGQGSSLTAEVIGDILPVVGVDWCRTPTQSFRSGWDGGNASSGGYNVSKLSIVSSGGVDELLWSDPTETEQITSYNKDPSVESPQFMYMHKDSSKSVSLFCSEVMNGNSGADYYSLNVDQADYPTDSLPTSFEFFFVGEP